MGLRLGCTDSRMTVEFMPISLSSREKEPSGIKAVRRNKFRRWWRKPLAVILLISLGIHLLLLFIFGGTVLFRERKSPMVFHAESVPHEKSVETEPPNPEETAHQEVSDEEAPPNEVGSSQEAVPAEAVVKLSGQSGWAPPVRGEGRVPVAGLSGKGTGRGRGKAQLFGAVVGDKKLGVIADVSGSMQPYLERVMREIFENFPNAEVVLVDGCGMESFDSSSPAPKSRSGGRKKKPRREEVSMTPPHGVDFSSQEGLSSPPIQGSGFGGLRQSYPKVFETLRKRSATWIVVGDGAESATRLAFDHLAGDHVQAIYWFSDFQDSVETGEGDRAAKSVRDNKIDVYLHPIDGLKNIRNWSEKVGAKTIEVELGKK